MILEKLLIRYIGKICIKSLRDFILDEHLTCKDSIVLNPENREELALEYRMTYNQPMPLPCVLLGVTIEEDPDNQVPLDRIGITEHPAHEFYSPTFRAEAPPVISLETVYRCGWCSNLVKADGSELTTNERNYKAQALQRFGRASVKYVEAECCKHRCK